MLSLAMYHKVLMTPCMHPTFLSWIFIIGICWNICLFSSKVEYNKIKIVFLFSDGINFYKEMNFIWVTLKLSHNFTLFFFYIKREFCKNQKDPTTNNQIVQSKIIALPLSCSSKNCNKICVTITTWLKANNHKVLSMVVDLIYYKIYHLCVIGRQYVQYGSWLVDEWIWKIIYQINSIKQIMSKSEIYFYKCRFVNIGIWWFLH
jgi:hypothetical protein